MDITGAGSLIRNVNVKRRNKILLLFCIGGVACLAGAILNPAGICRRHEYLFRDTVELLNGASVKVRALPNGWREQGRAIVSHRSYWGAPYHLIIAADGIDGTKHRIVNVRLVAKGSGTASAITGNDQLSKGESGSYTFFMSQEATFPYCDYWVEFEIEENTSLRKAFYRISLERKYREFWASDLIDMLMSV